MSSIEKTAIITGASSGIGKAVAINLAEKGYTLLLIARNEKKLLEVKNNLVGNHYHSAIDVADSQAVHQSVKSFISQTGKIDILFNSAGYVKRGTSLLAEEEFLKMINTNLLGTFLMIQAVAPYMKEKNYGYIITVSSYSGKFPRALLGGYAASKSGIAGFCESLYREFSSTGISVTTISPQLVDTEMTSDVDMPRNQMLNVKDIVKTVNYILSLSPSVGIKEIALQCKVRIAKYETY